MHLIKQLELHYILRISPDPVEGVVAEATDPAFLAAEVRPNVPSFLAGGCAALAREPPPAQGRALVKVRARHWPRHGDGLVEV